MATLKASQQGLARIKQARSEKSWSVDDFRWIELASEVLGVSWKEKGVLAVGISEGTWKRFLAGKQAINSEAFKAYCQVLGLNWEEVAQEKEAREQGSRGAEVQEKNSPHIPISPSPSPLTDWGEAPDVSIFYGRCEELEIVKRWVTEENCRLVTLLGMGGIGKTTLSVKLTQEIITSRGEISISQFPQYIIWRSLRNAPPVEDILAQLIQFFSEQQQTNLPSELSARILLLLKYLRSSRCLMILDNAESILQAGDRNGRYRPGCEGYGQLLQYVAETSHQSCVILTSREKPQGLAKYEGDSLPVRSLQLTGLLETEGRKLFSVKGKFTASQDQWQVLISRYGGNPLALKIVASSIRDFFDGNVSQFLEISQQGTFIFDDIRDLLDQQFHRLTTLEREIMYWLAINREPISLAELQADFVAHVPPRELLESLSSLQRRSVIEKSAGGFTQQPVVMEYVSNQLIEQVCQEIGQWEREKQSSSPTPLFTSHALIKAQAKDYVRESQISLILQPIIDRLITELGSLENITNCLTHILSTLRGKSPQVTGYAGGNALNLLHQAQIDISGYDFSGLTVWQAYLQGVNLHDVNFVGSDLSRCVFTETLGNILSAAFSPDGQLLATCDTDCHVRVWEVKTGKLLLICQGHINWVRFVVFSPDGEILASCGADQNIKLWNVRDGVCIKTLTGHEHEVFSVAFHPEGEILASASGDQTLKLWDIRDGKCLQTLTGHTDWVRCVAFSPDGHILASSGADHTIKLWPVQQGKCLKTLQAHTLCVRSVAFSADGQTLASASGDRTIKLWNYHTGECLQTYTGHTNSVYSIAYSPDSKILVSGSGDRTVKIWDCQTHTCIKTLHGHTNEVCSVAFSPDGHTLVCVSLDQSVRLWDCFTGQCLKTWYGNTDWALPVAFSPDGRILASGSNDRTVKLWDWQAGSCIRSLEGHTDFIYGIAFSPDGQILASASTDSSVRLWNISTGQCFQILLGHTDWLYAVAFHPQNKILATGSADCTAKLWDISTGQCFKTLSEHTDKIIGIAWSPDGQMLATASADQSVKLWDYSTGSCISTLQGHNSRVYSAIFSPDGKIIATCSTDQTVKLWNVNTGKCFKTLTGHTNWVFSVALSHDGNTIASASHDQTVRIWDINTGECRHVCVGHTHLVSSVAFSPNGEVVVSGSQDQTVRIWDVKTGDCIKILRAKRLYEGMNITGVKGLTDATILTLQSLGAVV
ncbi:NB-ARC domain-containing protein [Fischerella thermalis]|uniref:WD40 domain-containing protein n=1 Tax=Fischerella thermalis TaxID=372787 RepID=UPI001A087659|nr:NB-ARC domain-containing protein [Fischerella thermalis]MBF1990110.1 pentapeptide repeat-containing protein [Fischerella thermalis M58_A2018_009]MBF2062550.1 pentapeptide repeat-containing protein [Fischerella thermalis M66_A2018_004]MBF2068656.1 pentapeptide repeat-containing protein [Fischerella thermalis M48_A2018_028]